MNAPAPETAPLFDRPTRQPTPKWSTPASPRTPTVLVLNTGAQRLEFSVFKEDREAPLICGHIDGLDSGDLVLRVGSRAPQRLQTPMPYSDPLDIAMGALRTGLPSRLALRAVVHRVVHGGESFVEPTVLDNDALVDLNQLAPLAPMHQVHNLAGIRAARRQWPLLLQIGCFDTAFHATLPELERRLALPESLDDQGVRRHGFHGLSYEHAVHSLRRKTRRMEGRALLAHIGESASLCATAGGRSVGTSMGFSSLDGMMMGTRCGSMDAGVVLHLLRQGWSLEQLEHLLYQESGLLGVSGLSADLQVLRSSPTPQARLALDLFVHRAVREAGGLVSLLGGIDLLAFTGSVGVHDSRLRADWVNRLSFLGLELDPRANATDCGSEPLPLHKPGSAVEVWVVPCDLGNTAAAAAWEHLAQNDSDLESEEDDAALLQPA